MEIRHLPRGRLAGAANVPVVDRKYRLVYELSEIHCDIPMAPIPRCALRLPPDDRHVRHPPPTAAPADTDEPDPAEQTETAPPKGAPSKRRLSNAGQMPLHAQRSHTRDSAEILEGAPEFSTGVTRDMAEVREHKLHEAGAAKEPVEGEEAAPDACAVLAQCQAEAEAAAAEAAAVCDEEDFGRGPVTTVAPPFDVAATPGDISADFCEDRAESPSSGYDLKEVVAAHKSGQRLKVKVVKKCQGKYAPVEAYPGLWGRQKALGERQQRELEMRTKRKMYEGMHERNRRRREKERRRCVEKSRMMRCRDQAKITETVDNIAVNKAYYLRFNYNKRLPFMPSTMTEHLHRFKKPPFKFFPKGSRPCRKEVDEFTKLRVTEVAKVGMGLTTSAPTVKIKA